MPIAKLAFWLTTAPLLMACLFSTSCTSIVDGVTDSAFDETEERQIKSDYRRLYNNEPLKYHRTEGDLRRHAVKEKFEDAWFEDDQ
jgi:hypothetical protein